NYSISSMRDGPEFPLAAIENRFQGASDLIKRGANVALYIRPVIPTVTKEDLNKIMDLARSSGINVVTVGGLYVDDRISESMAIRGIAVSKASKTPDGKHLIMDIQGKLQKLDDREVSEIRLALRNGGFQVFNSAFDISRDFASKIAAHH